jgi:hypothetical protein
MPDAAHDPGPNLRHRLGGPQGLFAGVNTAYLVSPRMQPLWGHSLAFMLPMALIIGNLFMALLIVLLAA